MVVLTPRGIEGHPLEGMFIYVKRSAGEGWMRLDVIDDAPGAFETIDERLRERRESALADRIERAQAPSSDAHGIASALMVAHWWSAGDVPIERR